MTKHLNSAKFLVRNIKQRQKQIKMMIRKFILGLILTATIVSCSSTKSVYSVAVPEGSSTVINVPAKKGVLTENEFNAKKQELLAQNA